MIKRLIFKRTLGVHFINSQDDQTPLFLTISEALRDQQFSKRTEQKYLFWMKKFIYFHKERNPKKLQEKQVQDFLTHLAVGMEASPSTQNIALKAVVFMYQHVLNKPLTESNFRINNKNNVAQNVALG